MLGAKKGERLTLVDRDGHVLARGRADRLGSRVFRSIRPGGGYAVRRRHGHSRTFFEGRKLKAGLNYVKVRDGVELR